jgi:hypothetical protein
MDSNSNNLAVTQILWTLHMLPTAHLPEAATNALVLGADTPALRLLAGADGDDDKSIAELFVRALSELSMPLLSEKEAARRYAFLISSQIVSGSLSPIDGARRIVEAARALEDKTFHELDPFIYAESEYESRPEDREFFSRQIAEEAARWMNREP